MKPVRNAYLFGSDGTIHTDPERTEPGGETLTPSSRRQVLAGVGCLGAGSVGSRFLFRTDSDVRYTQYTTVTGDDGDRVRVAWRETYNGERRGSDGSDAPATVGPDESPAYVGDASGPAIDLSDVVPGDTGRLAVGLRAEDGDDWTPSAVWLRTALIEDCENGVTEPEARSSGEDEPRGRRDCEAEPGIGTGELGSGLRVGIWRDDGPLDACDGRRTPVAEPYLASGSARAVFTGPLADGIRAVDCLPRDERSCLAVEWSLPGETGNHVQTDSAAFALELATTGCDAGTPFGGERS